MSYMTVKEAARRWGISERLVQQLCTDGRVKGAEKFGTHWVLPADSEKPGDPRRSAGTANRKNPTEYSASAAMPLINTAFVPGTCAETLSLMEEGDLRSIACAEFYYFSGQAEKASDIAERYLEHEALPLRLSACWLYAYSNLTLGRIDNVRRIMTLVREIRSGAENADLPEELRALVICICTGVNVLLHLPLPEGLPSVTPYLRLLPPGLRLFALYVQAHHAYLQKNYGISVGIAETALALEGEAYPIPSVYLHLVATMSFMSLHQPEQAKRHLLAAWELAKPDDLIEAFGEHHGLLGGMLETVLKKNAPEDFRRIIAITYKFSAGWRKIHNPATGHSVADNLSTTEFTVAMLAARGWSNKAIAAHMDMSENTVKNYVTLILQKLQIGRRKDLIPFMLD